MNKVVGEYEKVPLRISTKQIELIHERTFAEDDLLQALSIAEVSGSKRKALLSLHDLEDLNGHVAAAANHCGDSKLERELDAIYDLIEKVERKYVLRD